MKSFDPDERIRSESVLLACTSDDAREGAFARLCRYPAAGVAWVWMHAFVDGRVIGFVDDRVLCSDEPLDTKADDVSYAPLDASLITLERRGARDAPVSATLHARVRAHDNRDTPLGAGPIDLAVEATCRPTFVRGATLFGRSEVLGNVETNISIDGERHTIAGRGQWHEQHQHAPRFRQPFSYASLQGDSFALVALGGPWGSFGFVRTSDGRDAETKSVTFGGLELVRVRTEGSSFDIRIDVVTAYTLPLYGRPWLGHQVVATSPIGRLSGFVNVWTP